MRKYAAYPTEDVLRDLYETQRLTTRQIGEQFGVKHITVRRWLGRYAIMPRAKGRGLANRGIEPPSREELYQAVHIEHESYDQISTRYGVDRSAVQHWLKNHGIERPTIWGTRRKGITIELPNESEVRELYQSGLSQEGIGELFGVSAFRIYRLFEKYGIQARPSGFSQGMRWQCEDGHVVRSSYEQRVDNWLHENGVPHSYEPSLPFRRTYRGDFLANGWYIEVWGIDGCDVYAARKAIKRNLYSAYGLPLIEIEKWQFAKARTTWMTRLKECLTPAAAQGMLF